MIPGNVDLQRLSPTPSPDKKLLDMMQCRVLQVHHAVPVPLHSLLKTKLNSVHMLYHALLADSTSILF